MNKTNDRLSRLSRLERLERRLDDLRDYVFDSFIETSEKVEALEAAQSKPRSRREAEEKLGIRKANKFCDMLDMPNESDKTPAEKLYEMQLEAEAKQPAPYSDKSAKPPETDSVLQAIVDNIDWSTRKIQIDRTPTPLDSLANYVNSSYYRRSPYADSTFKDFLPEPAKPPETDKPANWHPDYVDEFMESYRGMDPYFYKALENRARQLFFNGQKYANSQKPVARVVPIEKVKELRSQFVRFIKEEGGNTAAASGMHLACILLDKIFSKELGADKEGGKDV